MRIGVISDTHNYFDPQITQLFEGVDHILHGGDIGLPRILHQLEDLAPVTAVLGNTDDAAFGYRPSEVVELGGRKFLLHHIVNPQNPDEWLRERLERDRPQVVVFGHSHKPFSQRIGQVLFLNPGYAGKSRFGMPRSLAILHCTEQEVRAEFLGLEGEQR